MDEVFMKKTQYYNNSGAKNTETTLDSSISRLKEDGIENFIVATTSGQTLLKAAKLLQAEDLKKINLIGMTLQAGTWEKYQEPDWETIKKSEELGAKVLTCTHALMGNVASSIKNKFGGVPPAELIAHTFYAFSQGTKVSVEITLNAVDAGLIPAGERVIAVAGDNEGADTSIVLTAVSSVNFFDLQIHEFIAKPY